jgi:putative transcriptional regulator
MKFFKPGHFLISEPFLNDPNFHRSVILLTGADAEGAFGFVLNHTTGLVISDILPELEKLELPVYQGGPVSTDNLYFIHRQPERIPEGVLFTEGLYLGGNINILKAELLNGNIRPQDVLFFIGYSGWSAGQLESEIEEKSWIVADPKSIDIFKKDPANLWKQILMRSGGENRIWANAPEDPVLN